jgi:hypothetical protein
MAPRPFPTRAPPAVRRPRSVVLPLCTALLAPATPSGSVSAQPLARPHLARPHLDWQTVETRYFRFHAPSELAGGTRSVAERMDAVYDAVAETALRMTAWPTQ